MSDLEKPEEGISEELLNYRKEQCKIIKKQVTCTLCPYTGCYEDLNKIKTKIKIKLLIWKLNYTSEDSFLERLIIRLEGWIG